MIVFLKVGYTKRGSIPTSTAIMRERLRRLRHVLRRKDNRLPKIILFGQPSTAKRNAARSPLGWKDSLKRDLRKMGASWESVKREALNRFTGTRSVRVSLRRLSA